MPRLVQALEGAVSYKLHMRGSNCNAWGTVNVDVDVDVDYMGKQATSGCVSR